MALDRIETLIRQLQGQSKIAFPYGAGWGDFGSGYEGATYSRHGRVVRLQGLVTKSGGTPTAADVIGTLPTGFRPAADLIFAVCTGGTATFGRVTVRSSGGVEWTAGSTTEADFTSLSGVCFVVDA